MKEQLKPLEGLFRIYYYQTVWDDFNTHEEVWEEYAKRHSDMDIKQLEESVEAAENIEKSELLEWVKNTVDGMSFDSAQELEEFLVSLKAFLKNNCDKTRK